MQDRCLGCDDCTAVVPVQGSGSWFRSLALRSGVGPCGRIVGRTGIAGLGVDIMFLLVATLLNKVLVVGVAVFAVPCRFLVIEVLHVPCIAEWC